MNAHGAGLGLVEPAWVLLAVALPLAGAPLVALTGRWPARRRQAALALLAAASLALALGFVPTVRDGTTVEAVVLHLTPQLWSTLRVDAAGALYGATVAALGLLALLYTFGYLEEGPHQRRFEGAFMACLGCTLGVAYAADLLTFLIFYEGLSVLAYVLIVHEQTPSAMAAGRTYIAYILVGGSLVLAGVLLVFHLVGDLTFAPGGVLAGDLPTGTLVVAFWCFIAGFGVKAALVPLHGWVAEAHPAAPAPFSALLSGVMVAAGGFGIARVLHEVFGVDMLRALGVLPWLAAVAGVTVVVGAWLALGQDDLKRRLAYSTVSQMAYLTLALALAGTGAAAAGLVHLVHHAFLKGTLFFCVGAWRRGVGARRVSELAGAGAAMPLTTAAFTLAALGMIGLPPLSGFVSKWWLGLGMLEADAAPWLAVLLLGALLAAGYLLPVVHAAYFAPGEARRVQRLPRAMVWPLSLAAAATLLLGLAANVDGFPLTLARRAAATWFGGD